MDFHHVRYFLAVCEALNFTKAAERCHVTQPSLTRAIQNLEQELGGRLFTRGRSGTTLTPLGEAMREELAQVQRHANLARVAAEEWTKGTRGVLRVGVSTAASPKGVGHFLGAFQMYCEGVTLTVREGTVDDLLPWLNRSDIDAALVAYPHVLARKPEVRCLYNERLVTLIPVRHNLASLDLVPLSGLAGERILMNSHSDLRNTILLALKVAKINVNIACHSSRDEWLIGMVAEEAGIAIVPEGLSVPPMLTTRPLSDPIRQQSIHLLLDTKVRANPLVGKMSDFADQYLLNQSNPVVTRVAF